MASESSELTFVRCPSCRSLVPASAARCRICNNQLEGTANAAGSDASRPSSRVRQKTISASAEELMSAEHDVTGTSTPGAAPIHDFSSPVGKAVEVEEENDPLAAFLQEFEDAPEPVVHAAPPQQESSAAAPANDDDDDEDDDLDSFLEDFEDFGGADEPGAPIVAPVKPPARGAPSSPAPVRGGAVDPFEVAEDPLADFMTTIDDDDVETSPAPQTRQQGAPPIAEPEPHREFVPEPPPVKRPEPPRQAEGRQNPTPPPSQHQRPLQQQPKQGRPGTDDRGTRDMRGGQAGTPQGGQHGGHQERREHRERDRHESPRPDRRHEESKKANGNQGGRPQERHNERPQERRHERQPERAQPQQPESPVSGPKTGKMRPGRLFGWLVSFESADGRAIELREGKFFVTGSSIRGTDLVIEDPSISTPHALMSVSAEKGLLIQDLMSERGVFMRSGDRGQYRREDGVIELKHGDWVRFGDVEFLLTVVPVGK